MIGGGGKIGRGNCMAGESNCIKKREDWTTIIGNYWGDIRRGGSYKIGGKYDPGKVEETRTKGLK